jgi:holo-[acyl-carrier protein] synthase
MVAHPKLVHDLFTVEEQTYCLSQSHPSQHFAARFCAKEAIVKALGIDGWDPLELEILPGDPAPVVRLYGDIAEIVALLQVDLKVSLSHLPSMAIATAFATPLTQI